MPTRADDSGAAARAMPGRREPPYEAAVLICDCDGVLVDSERLGVEIDVRALARLGITMTGADVVRRFVGRTEADVVAEVGRMFGGPLPADWVARWIAEYRTALDADLQPVPYAVELLDAVEARGIRTCVASSGSHEKLRRTLGKTRLYDRFAGRIFSADDVVAGKPAPDVFLHAAASLRAAPADCVVIEDSRYGIQAARAAGMAAIGYTGGVTPADLLAAADALVADLREVPPLLTPARSRAAPA